MIKEIKWEEASTIFQDYINVVIAVAEHDLSCAFRDKFIQKKYDFYKLCIQNVFETARNTIKYCYDIPQFDNLTTIETTTEDEKKVWYAYDNDYNSFIGMWEFFGKRIPIFIDDPGQQYYAKYLAKDGSIVDISGGAYNTSSDDIAYQVLEYIEEDILFDIRNKIKEFHSEIEIKA